MSFGEDFTFILFTNSLVNKLYAFSISYFATEVSLGSLDQLFLPSHHPKMLNVKIPTDKSFLLKLANGLDFIHSKNLVHGDIRPENVLVFSSSNSKTVSFKWTGFGLFKSVDPIPNEPSQGQFKVDGARDVSTPMAIWRT